MTTKQKIKRLKHLTDQTRFGKDEEFQLLLQILEGLAGAGG
jgi:hypothetical protein